MLDVPAIFDEGELVELRAMAELDARLRMELELSPYSSDPLNEGIKVNHKAILTRAFITLCR